MAALSSAIKGMSSTIYSNLFIELPIQKGDLTGQTVIVTGSNQGLGYEASRHFLLLGVERLIMAVRNLEKGKAARLKLLEDTVRDPSAIEVWELDMDSYASVKKFATRVETLPRLDALLANAGLATTTFNLSEDNEKTITVNVVGTFLLILLLLPKLRESASKFDICPRVSIVNSALHYIAPLAEIDVSNQAGIFSRLNNKKTANMAMRYPLSKLLLLFAVRALAKRLEESKGPMVVVNTPNPSWCKSQLMRENESFGNRVGERMMARSTEEGSRALVNGILSGKESSGQYIDNCQVKSPACIVTNPKGTKIQEAFFNELMEKLEKISPGIGLNI
ncbi:Short-chain dehydrogenase/reductase SDR [Penicillium subrubescens]|uniref:Short-chain dehydrogenase/reductase SDR n=1 Tax=Penicillium subrubescens TaxID=1316194 RepID=UPI0025453925|nr:Short-chain dehydrogenase/reductase SDR [Penicillium subrubescens]KAJ5896517.1 Short-chain dehydrogenase/reductase SDR [Penicillium subrubescens]